MPETRQALQAVPNGHHGCIRRMHPTQRLRRPGGDCPPPPMISQCGSLAQMQTLTPCSTNKRCKSDGTNTVAWMPFPWNAKGLEKPSDPSTVPIEWPDVASVSARKKGHGEALPASPWPIHLRNEGTVRSTLPIHGTSSIGKPMSDAETVLDLKTNFSRFCLD